MGLTKESLKQLWENIRAQIKTDIAVIDQKISKIEIKDYIHKEADRVAKNVYTNQNANTFSFLVVSDMFNLLDNNQITESNIHAGQGMDLIRKNANIDFAVCLGNNAWRDENTTIAEGIEEIRTANSYISEAFEGIPNFRTSGNFDTLYKSYKTNNKDFLNTEELFQRDILPHDYICHKEEKVLRY